MMAGDADTLGGLRRRGSIQHRSLSERSHSLRTATTMWPPNAGQALTPNRFSDGLARWSPQREALDDAFRGTYCRGNLRGSIGPRPGRPAAATAETPKSPTPCGDRWSSWLHTKKSGKDTMNDTHELPGGPESAARPRGRQGLALQPAAGASSPSPASPSVALRSASAPPAVAPPRPATSRARPRAAPARPARSCSSPACSGARRPASIRSARPSPIRATGIRSQLIYESLLRFNLLDGSLQPGLGKELQEMDATTFVVALQDGTKWSDGSELTADGRGLHVRAGQGQQHLLLRRLDIHRLGHRAGPAQRAVQAQDQAVNPGSVRNYIANTLIMPQGGLEQDRSGASWPRSPT